jgi:hypothetical protein
MPAKRTMAATSPPPPPGGGAPTCNMVAPPYLQLPHMCSPWVDLQPPPPSEPPPLPQKHTQDKQPPHKLTIDRKSCRPPNMTMKAHLPGTWPPPATPSAKACRLSPPTTVYVMEIPASTASWKGSRIFLPLPLPAGVGGRATYVSEHHQHGVRRVRYNQHSKCGVQEV